MHAADIDKVGTVRAGRHDTNASFVTLLLHPLLRAALTMRTLAPVLLIAAAIVPAAAQAATPAFHFESICNSDVATNKDTVTLVLHGPDVRYPDGSYGQNRAVFKYRQDSCTTTSQGACRFNGGSGGARWQLAEVVGYDLSSPAFDTAPTAVCSNTLMIDFW